MNSKKALKSIEEKVEKKERLSDDDALFLFREADILALGALANRVREGLHAKKTYYIVNRHIDYSNLCVIRCKFCAFARKRGEEGGFQHSVEEILGKVREGEKAGITEIHMVGGFHPDHSWEFYTGLLQTVKREFPKIHIKAYTASEIRYFSKKFRKSEEEILRELTAAGLDSLPGGGAEIFAEKVRKEICGPKGPAEHWLSTHRLAHRLGLRSTATMLYGHVESIEDRVDHLRRLRELQDETEGFLAFIPLAFNPKGTAYEERGYTSGLDDLRTLAVSRLYLDNFRHIKAYWIMSGLEVAQMAQYFGADDLHGTVMEEHITHMAGGLAPSSLPAARLKEVIRQSGRLPIQRDSLYREVV